MSNDSKHYQESAIVFRRTSDSNDYPHSRGIVVYQYGGTVEERIKEARKTFILGQEWEVISAELP